MQINLNYIDNCKINFVRLFWLLHKILIINGLTGTRHLGLSSNYIAL